MKSFSLQNPFLFVFGDNKIPLIFYRLIIYNSAYYRQDKKIFLTFEMIYRGIPINDIGLKLFDFRINYC